MLRALLVVAIAYAVWLALAFFLQRPMVFLARMTGPLGPPPAGVEVLRLGERVAWFVPAGGGGPAPLVVGAHGNAETIEGWTEIAEGYRARGVSVLLPEYRGYAGTPGTPAERGLVQDFAAFLDVALARPEVDPRRVVFHGRSLGGGVVLALARERAPAAVILDSTFTSVADFARRFLVPRFAVRDPFDNVAALRELDRPVLILHGRPDRVIPVSHAHALAAAARHPTLVLHDQDHNDPPPAEYWPAIDAFLARALPPG